jgi:hypothetical protein
MNKLTRRSLTVVFILLGAAPLSYLALGIRAFRENPSVIDPHYEGLVDCLDGPVGRPFEILLKVNGVGVDYLRCAKYERQVTEGTCSPSTLAVSTNHDRYLEPCNAACSEDSGDERK